MIASATNAAARATRAISSTATANARVAVLGAAGGIGQPLSMLLALSPEVSELNCYDVAPFTPGVGVDLDHCDADTKVTGFAGDDLAAALDGCDAVIIPAGVPRKPGMTRQDLFDTNASIVKTLATAVGKHAPNACLGVISNPVNSMVPICRETLLAAGVYNPQKLFGITTLDVVRANKFVSTTLGTDPTQRSVKVIGGHAGATILPILSQEPDFADLTQEQIDALTHRIQFGGDEVVQAKAGAGSATLSMAWAGASFTKSLLKALAGEQGVTECTFVENDLTDAPFFSTPVTLGKDGVEEIHHWGQLSDAEEQALNEAVPTLVAQANAGIEFCKSS